MFSHYSYYAFNFNAKCPAYRRVDWACLVTHFGMSQRHSQVAVSFFDFLAFLSTACTPPTINGVRSLDVIALLLRGKAHIHFPVDDCKDLGVLMEWVFTKLLTAAEDGGDGDDEDKEEEEPGSCGGGQSKRRRVSGDTAPASMVL